MFINFGFDSPLPFFPEEYKLQRGRVFCFFFFPFNLINLKCLKQCLAQNIHSKYLLNQ